MTSVQIAIYVILLCAEILGVASIMEVYKKSLRKGKASIWEIRGVSLGLSAVAVGLLVLAGVFQPFLGLIGAKVWIDAVFQTVVFFFLQMQADLKIVKKTMSSFVKTFLKSKGFTDAQIKEIFEAVKVEA